MKLVTSARLMDRARAGDPQAFQKLVQPHLEKVYRFARVFAHDWGDAEDIAQEALVKAFGSFENYREDASLSTWLYQITKNTGIDWYRSKLSKWRKRETEVPLDLAEEAPSQIEMLQERERAEALWKAIRSLDPQFRVPLVLYEIEGMSCSEVARIERIPEGTVRSRLTRARAKLAKSLGGTPEFDQSASRPPESGAVRALTSSQNRRTS